MPVPPHPQLIADIQLCVLSPTELARKWRSCCPVFLIGHFAGAELIMAVSVPAIKAFFSSRFPLIVGCVPSIIYVLCIEYAEGVGYDVSYIPVVY